MCLAACHWAHIDPVYFGATIAAAPASGFNEPTLPAQEMVTRVDSPLRVVGAVLHDEGAVLFEEWQRRADTRPY